ncbi:hypothetical protein ACJX0J_028762, partial [Zea mays]
SLITTIHNDQTWHCCAQASLNPESAQFAEEISLSPKYIFRQFEVQNLFESLLTSTTSFYKTIYPTIFQNKTATYIVFQIIKNTTNVIKF